MRNYIGRGSGSEATLVKIGRRNSVEKIKTISLKGISTPQLTNLLLKKIIPCIEDMMPVSCVMVFLHELEEYTEDKTAKKLIRILRRRIQKKEWMK